MLKWFFFIRSSFLGFGGPCGRSGEPKDRREGPAVRILTGDKDGSWGLELNTCTLRVS